MELALPEELEGKLSRLAAELGRDRDALIVEAIERMVDHDAWFTAEVEKGLADVERGAMLNHEDLGKRLEDQLRQRRSA